MADKREDPIEIEESEEDQFIDQLVNNLEKLDPGVRTRALDRLGFVEAARASNLNVQTHLDTSGSAAQQNTGGDKGPGNNLDISDHSVPSGSFSQQNPSGGVGSNQMYGPQQDGHRPRTLGPMSDRVSFHVPRLSTFSGDGAAKGDVSFSRWKFEVNSLLQDGETQGNILQAIRRSVRGTAVDVITSLPFSATPADVLKKFEGFFGDVLSGETLMQLFYNAHQDPEQSVASWACELETVLNKAIAAGKVRSESRNDMLFSKFWVDLDDDRIKAMTRHHYDSLTEFDQLFVVVRTAEQDIKGKPEKPGDKGGRKAARKAQTFQQTAEAKPAEGEVTMKDIMVQLKELCSTQKHLTRRLDRLEKQSPQSDASVKPKQSRTNLTKQRVLLPDIICYRCGQDGHVALKCHSKHQISQEEVEAIKERQRQSLNSRTPLSGGR